MSWFYICSWYNGRLHLCLVQWLWLYDVKRTSVVCRRMSFTHARPNDIHSVHCYCIIHRSAMSYACENECNHILEITLIPTIYNQCCLFFIMSAYNSCTCNTMCSDSHSSQQIVACCILPATLYCSTSNMLTSTRNKNTQYSMYMLCHLRGNESLDQKTRLYSPVF